MNCVVNAGVKLDVKGDFLDGRTEVFYLPVRFKIKDGKIVGVDSTHDLTLLGEVRTTGTGGKACAVSLQFHAASEIYQGPFDNRD